MFAAFWIVILSFLPQFIWIPSLQWPWNNSFLVVLQGGELSGVSWDFLLWTFPPVVSWETSWGGCSGAWGVGKWKPQGLYRITLLLRGPHYIFQARLRWSGWTVAHTQGAPGQYFCMTDRAGAMLCCWLCSPLLSTLDQIKQHRHYSCIVIWYLSFTIYFLSLLKRLVEVHQC